MENPPLRPLGSAFSSIFPPSKSPFFPWGFPPFPADAAEGWDLDGSLPLSETVFRLFHVFFSPSILRPSVWQRSGFKSWRCKFLLLISDVLVPPLPNLPVFPYLRCPACLLPLEGLLFLGVALISLELFSLVVERFLPRSAFVPLSPASAFFLRPSFFFPEWSGHLPCPRLLQFNGKPSNQEAVKTLAFPGPAFLRLPPPF